MTRTETVPPPAPEQAPRLRPPWWAAVLAGLVSGAVTVGVAELLAAVLSVTGLAGGQPSPVISVGDAFVDRTPGPVKDFAVATFGANDKVVLLASIGLVLLVLAVAAGLAAARRLAAGLGLVLLLGLVAMAAVLTRPSAAPLDVVPTVVGIALGLVTLRWLVDLASAAPVDGPVDGQADGWSRRAFLGGAGAAGAAAVVAGGAGHVVESALDNVEDSRAAVRLPPPVERATVPDDVQLPIAGITPWRTDPATFYRVDTALRLPRITTAEWSLRVHGLVGRELTLDYRTLLRKPLVERVITLTCVSNEVGGQLLGNAVWLGYPIKDLLADAGVDPGADMVLSTSKDGMTISTPLANLTRDRDAILAIAMNGEPLPVEHGFPVRMVVPGLYGYVSATKWVTDLKVTRFADDEAYWTPRGYSAQAPIKISSRIDVPKGFARLKAGRNAVAGTAWAQTKGISAVQVRIDKGPWQDARLAGSAGQDSWVQWVHEWDAEPGSHTIECRVVDGDGNAQVERRHGIRPDGSTGLDSRNVTVS